MNIVECPKTDVECDIWPRLSNGKTHAHFASKK